MQHDLAPLRSRHSRVIFSPLPIVIDKKRKVNCFYKMAEAHQEPIKDVFGTFERHNLSPIKGLEVRDFDSPHVSSSICLIRI